MLRRAIWRGTTLWSCIRWVTSEGALIKELHKWIPLLTLKIYWGAQKGAALQNLVRYAASLFTLQEIGKSNITCSNNHVDTRGKQKHLIIYTRKEKVTPVKSIEQSRGSVSSSSSTSSNKESKRLERRKCQKSRRSRQQSNRTYISTFITHMVQTPQYSNPTPKRTNTESYRRFCFDC